MKNILILFFFITLLSSCNNFEMKDLYGSWSSENIEFTFNEDKTMACRIGSLNEKGRFRPFGNTIELVNAEEKVLTRITIKSLKDDQLIIDLPNIGSKIYTLKRVK